MADFQAAFEHRNRLVQISFREEQNPQTAIHMHKTSLVIGFLRDSNALLSVQDSFAKATGRRKTLYQVAAATYGQHQSCTQAFMSQIAFNALHTMFKNSYGLTILARLFVSDA